MSNGISVRQKKFYNLLLVLQPILSVYASPVPALDLGTTICIIWGLYAISKGKIRILSNRTVIGIILYTIAVTVGNLVVSTSGQLLSSEFSVIVRLSRFVLMLFIMVLIGMGGYFEYNLALKYLRRLSLFVAIYAMAQLVFFRITGSKLINVFGPTKQGVVFQSALSQYEVTYRPPSIFLEPSSVIYYLTPYLCICFFGNQIPSWRISKRQVIDGLIVSSGMIATTSGQGIIVAFTVWAIWFVKNIVIRGSASRWVFGAIVLAIAFSILSTNTSVQYSISRIFPSSNEMSAIDARSSGYKAFENLSTIHKMFGTGYGNYNEKIYYSSIADIMCCTGIFGLVLVSVLYLRIFFRGNAFKKVLAICSIILMLGGGIYTATYLCMYLPLLLCNETMIELVEVNQDGVC